MFNLQVEDFFNQPTCAYTFLVYDGHSRDAVIIDSLLDYNYPASKLAYSSADALLERVKLLGLRVHYLLETHAHADHLSGAHYIKTQLPQAKTAIGEHITHVQKIFSGLFNINIATDGSQFDRLLEDDETIECGSVRVKILHTPGHTPSCCCFLVNDQAVFTGDTIFMPDYGTARCDFPGGDAAMLYRSVTRKLFTLPDQTKNYVGHDYQPGGRREMCATTIGAQKRDNIMLNRNTSEEKFVAAREARDAGLNAPNLLLPSIQVNIRAGELPAAEDNGKSYLKIPVRT